MLVCELAMQIVKLADKLNQEEIMKAFEMNGGCLDAFEELQNHENPKIAKKAFEFV